MYMPRQSPARPFANPHSADRMWNTIRHRGLIIPPQWTSSRCHFAGFAIENPLAATSSSRFACGERCRQIVSFFMISERGGPLVGQFLKRTTGSWVVSPNFNPLVGQSEARPPDGMQTRIVPYTATRSSCGNGQRCLCIAFLFKPLQHLDPLIGHFFWK